MDERKIGDYQCVRQLKCRHEGNVQECLDELIDLNESEVLWQDGLDIPIIPDKDYQQGFQFRQGF
jgi:hypothetical protein